MAFIEKLLKRFHFKTILDIGCTDNTLELILRDKEYLGIDTEPKFTSKNIKKIDLSSMPENKRFDVVLALQVLEHTKDPIAALNKMKNLTNKYLIISVPYEPIFTLFRLLIPEREHRFVIFPWALKERLGKPIYEKSLVFGRQYLGVWDISGKHTWKKFMVVQKDKRTILKKSTNEYMIMFTSSILSILFE